MKRTMNIGKGRSITFDDESGEKVYESLEAWKVEGERRFGKDILKWKFKRPMCGHVAAVEEFKKAGAEDPVNCAYEECLGRYTGKAHQRKEIPQDAIGLHMAFSEYQRAVCMCLLARSRELIYLILQRRASDGKFGCYV